MYAHIQDFHDCIIGNNQKEETHKHPSPMGWLKTVVDSYNRILYINENHSNMDKYHKYSVEPKKLDTRNR